MVFRGVGGVLGGRDRAVVGPGHAEADPAFEVGDDGAVELLLGRHGQLGLVPEDDEQGALARLVEIDGRPLDEPSFEDRLSGVESQSRGLLLGTVAGETLLGQHGPDPGFEEGDLVF